MRTMNLVIQIHRVFIYNTRPMVSAPRYFGYLKINITIHNRYIPITQIWSSALGLTLPHRLDEPCPPRPSYCETIRSATRQPDNPSSFAFRDPVRKASLKETTATMADTEYVSAPAVPTILASVANIVIHSERRGGCRYVLKQLYFYPSPGARRASQELKIFGWSCWWHENDEDLWHEDIIALTHGDGHARNQKPIADRAFA